MNKKLEAKINIKDITTINPYSDKPNTLAYNIINNAVALTNEEKSLGYAELVGAPYSKVAAEKTEIDLSFVLPVILVKKYAYVNPTSNKSTKNIPVTLTIIFCLLFMNFFPPFTYKKII